MRVEEFISSFDPNQKIAVVSNSKLVWAGSVSDYSKSENHETFSNLVVKHIGLPRNAFGTYFGGNSQEWGGLIVEV